MDEIREYSRIVKRRKVEDHGTLCRKITEEGIRDWSSCGKLKRTVKLTCLLGIRFIENNLIVVDEYFLKKKNNTYTFIEFAHFSNV